MVTSDQGSSSLKITRSRQQTARNTLKGIKLLKKLPKKSSLFNFIICALIVSLFGCASSPKDSDPSTPLPFGDRLVFIALTPAAHDLDLTPALNVVLNAGGHGPGDINLDWGALEPLPESYIDPDGILAWARETLHDRKVHLTLAPIQTSYVTVPPDLEGFPWDNPLLVSRFLSAMEYVAGELKGVPILTVAIGNEVDIVLENDQEAWNAYLSFFEIAAKRARELWPDAQIGVKLTNTSLIENIGGKVSDLVSKSDAVLATFYPEVVPANQLRRVIQSGLDALIEVGAGKPVHVVEIGYPSSSALGSSEMDQAAFVDATFFAWDVHRQEIPSICFVWLHDLTPESLEALMKRYGTNDPKLRAWLGSLGMRGYNGEDKPAFVHFRHEVAVRR